ncbi:MAG TPA: hypothetical protein DDY77_01135 [Clostridiales bacterium]|nr:hypothetical protein [Clostridiales bacterium]
MNLGLFTIAGFSFGLDLVIGIILLIYGIIGIVKGFFKELLGFIGTTVSFIVAAIFCVKLATLVIENTAWDDSLATLIAGNFPNDEVALSALPDALSSLNIPFFLNTPIIDYATSLNTETVVVSAVIGGTAAKYIMIAASFLAIVLAVKIICAIIGGIMKALKTALPFIKGFDRLLGLLLGIVKGAVFVCGLLYLLELIPISQLDFLREEVASSALATFLSKNNLFVWLTSLIKF